MQVEPHGQIRMVEGMPSSDKPVTVALDGVVYAPAARFSFPTQCRVACFPSVDRYTEATAVNRGCIKALYPTPLRATTPTYDTF